MPHEPKVDESNRQQSRVDDAIADYRGSYSLDMIAPLPLDLLPNPGGLLALWEDISVAQLPRTLRAFVESQAEVSPHEVLVALLQPAAIAEACADFADAARRLITERFDARSAEICLLRSGLLTNSVPTLEEVGRQFELTRERVRQLEKHGEGIVEETKTSQSGSGVLHSPSALRLQGYRVARRAGAAQKFADRVTCEPLAHALRAWFDLNPARPLAEADLNALTGRMAGTRCCQRVLEILHYPSLSWNGNLWFRTQAQRRACEAVLAAAKTCTGATSWPDITDRIRGQLPGVERVLDLEPTLRLLGEIRDFGVGMDGRILRDRSRLTRRVARKIVTYLKARVAPVSVDELAKAISLGQIPFHVFQRSAVTPSWLKECVQSAEGLVVQLKDGRIALAPSLAGRPPTGAIGILYSVVVRHGEPMRMQDLCDKAGSFGLSRNQVGMLIHSRRAACLFMLSRGIVGLVGRDEAADPGDYKPAVPARFRNIVRP